MYFSTDLVILSAEVGKAYRNVMVRRLPLRYRYTLTVIQVTTRAANAAVEKRKLYEQLKPPPLIPRTSEAIGPKLRGARVVAAG